MPGRIIAPLVAQRMGLMTMGTFHQRRGDRSLLDATGAPIYFGPGMQGDTEQEGAATSSAIWSRVFGARSDLGANATLNIAGYAIGPQFDGNYWGLQIGSDIAEIEHDNGHVDRFGVFYTHANASGDASGNILGRSSITAGTLDLNEDSFAVYWTSLSANGWYLDTVAKYGWLNGDSQSNRGISSDIDGTTFAVSMETGMPFSLSDRWTIEPQAQLIWQNIRLDDAKDRFADITNEPFDAFTGRLGARLQYTAEQGYIHFGGNLWHGFSAEQTVKFNEFPLTTEIGGTWLEVNAGAAYQLSENLSLFGDVSYSFDVDGAKNNMIGGQIGLRLKF